MKTDAYKIMRRAAKDAGYSVRLNSRGDLKIYHRRKFRGVIIILSREESLDNQPSPIASRSICDDELEPLRSVMCDQLVVAGVLRPARS